MNGIRGNAFGRMVSRTATGLALLAASNLLAVSNGRPKVLVFVEDSTAALSAYGWGAMLAGSDAAYPAPTSAELTGLGISSMLFVAGGRPPPPEPHAPVRSAPAARPR